MLTWSRFINKKWFSVALITCLFIGKFSFSQELNSHYIATKYNLKDIIPENQIKQILKDKNGFYWLLANSGYLIRWNGKNFNVVNQDLKYNGHVPNFYYAMEAQKNTYYLTDFTNHQIHYLTTTSEIIRTNEPAQTQFFKHAYIGNHIYLKKTITDIRKLNPPGQVVENFILAWKGMKNYPWKFQVHDEAFFFANNSDVVSYSNGKIKELVTFRSISGAWTVGQHILILNGTSYQVFDKNGNLISHGRNALFKKASFTECKFQLTGEATFLTIKNRIYRLSIKDTSLVISSYFDLPVSKKSFTNMYIDELTGRILTADLDGGFTVFENRYFNTIINSDDPAWNIIYTLKKENNQFITNQNFQRHVIEGINDYDLVGPFCKLKNGNIFYPTTKGFVIFENKEGRKKAFFPLKIERVVKSILPITDTIYVAAEKLWMFNTQTYKIDTISISSPGNNEYVQFICKGPENTAFLATNSFLYSVDLTTNTVQRLPGSKIDGDMIRTLFFDESYNFLFYTISGKGIFYYDLNKKISVTIPINKITALLSCHYLLKDKDGDFWLPTNIGLFLMKKKQFDLFVTGQSKFISFFSFGKEQGLVNEEFNGGFSGNWDVDGDSLFLASIAGIVSFSPDKIKNYVKIINEGRILSDAIVIDDSILAKNPVIRLPANFKSLVASFDFPFINRPGAALEYQLNGLSDTSWLPLTQDNSIIIRGLPAGTYKLTVRVKDIPEVKTITYTIHVEKYWHQTTVAYIGFILLTGMLIFIVTNWHINKIKSKSLEERDKSRRELFAIISHDLRSPLKSYQGMADTVAYLLKEGDYERIKKVAAQIDSTGIKIDLLLSNLLKWNLLEEQKMNVDYKEVNCSELIMEILPVYEDLMQHKNCSLNKSINDNIVLKTDESLFALIVRNLLDNAIKNSPMNTDILLSFQQYYPGAILSLKNKFVLSQKQKLQIISSVISENKNWEPGTKGMGMGLKMIKLATVKLNASMQMHLHDDYVEWTISFL